MYESNCKVRGAFWVPTQWTQPSQIGPYSRMLHQRSSRSDTCPASPISRHTCAAIGSSYSSLDGARLLRREDPENDTTAVPNAANCGQGRHCKRHIRAKLTCPLLDCCSTWPTSKWRKQGVWLRSTDRRPLRAANARGRRNNLG